MNVERYEKWEPVGSVYTPAARAVIREDHKGLLVNLIFSETVDGSESDLQISFGRVPVYAIYEEFVHPWNYHKTESPPKLEEKWQDYSFPLLVVKDSIWMQSFSDSQLLNHPECIHYRLVTLDQTVDVLCNRVPEVAWVQTSRT